MGFVEASKSYLVKWLNFKERTSRSEYWWGYLFSVIFSFSIGFIIGFVSAIIGVEEGSTTMGQLQIPVMGLLQLPLTLFLVIAGLSLSVRRLHDIDRSGWWFLIIFTIIGIFVLIYWACKKGDEVENRFGTNPLGSEPVESAVG